jgi:predicted deacylase
MTHERVEYDVEVGTRIDGTPWRLRVVEHRAGNGPATAVLGGMYGDKAMSCLAVHELDRRLTEADLAGTVVLVPAVNLPGLDTGTRVNRDHLSLNRRFPGSATGFLTDQFANAIDRLVRDSADCVVDLHSGTPTMSLWYTYDYGDLELSASFGLLPIATGFGHPGQLGTHARKHDVSLLLPEWGGGALTDIEPGIEGTLNVLKYRGHVPGDPTGPATLPLITRRDLMLSSAPGVFETALAPDAVGTRLEPGTLGWITNANTGDRVEEFTVEEDGGILMMAATGPAIVGPGDFTFMVGYADDEVPVPGGRR